MKRTSIKAFHKSSSFKMFRIAAHPNGSIQIINTSYAKIYEMLRSKTISFASKKMSNSVWQVHFSQENVKLF